MSCRCLTILLTTLSVKLVRVHMTYYQAEIRLRKNMSFLSQDPKASSWRVPNALCMWFTHQRGRSSPWAVGFAEMPTPSKQHKPFTENQFVYCDFQLLLKLSREAWLLHCQVSWTLNQVFALRQESSGLLFYQHQYPGSATNTSCGSFGFRVT